MARTIDTRRAAKIVMVAGSSGSGKSAWVKQQVRRATRLIVWDVDDEYTAERCERIRDLRELAERLKTRKTGRFAYVPHDPKDFGAWARLAFAWGECAVVAEELADVTSPAKAPPGWGELVRRGRKRGVILYAVTQRPSESDKTALGNASEIHVGRLARAADRRYMAAELDIAPEEIAALNNLEYIHKDMAANTVKKGKLKFR